MKINKNKGKVHPSPSSNPPPPSSNRDASSVLNKVLPAAILALTVILPLDDREVLAYMITRSMKTSTSSSIAQRAHKQKGSKKKPDAQNDSNHEALFHCDCFHCYTSFWFRWDSSPSRELIHQAIDAFEDHLSSSGEKSPNPKRNGKCKNKDKSPRRFKSGHPETDSTAAAGLGGSPPLTLGASAAEVPKAKLEDEREGESSGGSLEMVEAAAIVAQSAAANGHRKGLVRRAMADVLVLLNSRLWSLWSPSV